MKNKNAKTSLLRVIIIYLIIIGILFIIFLFAINNLYKSKDVKQQVIEKQLALLIDSALPNTELIVNKQNRYGFINNLTITDEMIFSHVDGNRYSAGYPYFSECSVSVLEEENEYIIEIK